MRDTGAGFHMVFVLSLGSFFPSVILIDEGMMSVLFMAGFLQAGLKVLRMRLNSSETL
jgi:hypothetical protein